MARRQLEKGGFARAVAPKQAIDTALVNVNGKIAQRGDFSVILYNRLEFNHENAPL
jgi:hypothetical protein